MGRAARSPRLERFALVVAFASATIGTPSLAGVPVPPLGFADSSVVGALSFPIAMEFLPDGRILFLQVWNARIRLVVNGAVGSVDPIGVVDSVNTVGWERGALGMAVDPEWPSRPYVYTYATALDGRIRISRLTATGDLANAASDQLWLDPASRRDVLRVIPDSSEVHNGGTLRFGPDGMLYASVGDDAGFCAAQDTVSLRGVLLRLDVSGLPDGPGPTPDPATLAPADNPFAGHVDPRARLVWALGFRNPFRFAFDPVDGAAWVGDVGWLTYEEVDRVPGPGGDLGWPWYEATTPRLMCGPLAPASPIMPVYWYDRAGFTGSGEAAVIGGAAYRRTCSSCGFPPHYDGDFFFNDYYEGFLRRLHFDGTTWQVPPPVPGQPSPSDWGRGYDRITDWHVGPDGALWYVKLTADYRDFTGEIRRIAFVGTLAGVPAPASSPMALEAPRPSPADHLTTIEFAITRPGGARLTIMDVAGRTLRVLVRAADWPVGAHRAVWDLRDASGALVPPGVYVVRLESDGANAIRKLVVAR